MEPAVLPQLALSAKPPAPRLLHDSLGGREEADVLAVLRGRFRGGAPVYSRWKGGFIARRSHPAPCRQIHNQLAFYASSHMSLPSLQLPVNLVDLFNFLHASSAATT
jgi:hypothetical protein